MRIKLLACLIYGFSHYELVVGDSQLSPEPTPDPFNLVITKQSIQHSVISPISHSTQVITSQVSEPPKVENVLVARDPQLAVLGVLGGLGLGQQINSNLMPNAARNAFTSLINSMSAPNWFQSTTNQPVSGWIWGQASTVSSPAPVQTTNAFQGLFDAQILSTTKAVGYGKARSAPPPSSTRAWGPPWMQGGGPFGMFDRFPAMAVHGGGDLQKTAYCSTISSSFTQYLARTRISIASGVARPTLSINLPPPDREEGAWLQCLPGPVASLVGVMPPWGPGPAPVVSVIAGSKTKLPNFGYGAPGLGPMGTNEAVCDAVVDFVAASVSGVYSSIFHSRLDNWNIGPRAGFPTVTIHVPQQGQPSMCVRMGIFSGGTIPGVWPRTAHAAPTVFAGTAPTAGVITAGPAPSVVYSTVYVTATPAADPFGPPSQAEGFGEIGQGGLTVETLPGDQVPCRPYADQLTVDWSKVSILDPKTRLNVNCWTVASLPGDAGVILGSNVWLHAARENCWIHSSYLGSYIPDISKQLQYCVTPLHQVGTLLPQYSRQDCYARPSLDAPSHNVGNGRHVDVMCELSGEIVQGNSTWIKSITGCYFPGAIFDQEWFGPPLRTCT